MKQLAVIQPNIVVLMGRVAAEGVLQKKVFVVKEQEEVIEEKDGIQYFLTYHPAAVLRFPNKFKSLMEDDFKKVKKIINK